MAANAIPSTCPGLHRRRVEFPSREQGVNLVGELVWPSERSSALRSTPRTSTSSTAPPLPLPVSVLAHGLADDRDSFVLPRLAEELALRAGVASLRFDFRGSGESGGEFRFGNAATRDGDPADLEAAVEFLRGFPDGGGGGGGGGGGDAPKFKVVALLGHSKAGSAVVSYAAARGRRTGGGAGDEKTGESEGGGEEAFEREETDDLFVPLIINVAGRFDHSDPRAITARFGQDIFDRVKEMEREGGVPITWRVVGPRSRALPGDNGGGGGRDDDDGGGGGEQRPPPRRTLEWRLTAADLADRLGTDMGALCRRLPAETRLLCIHGTRDATVPPSAAERFRAAAAEEEGGEPSRRRRRRPLRFPPRVVMVEGADHNFTQRDKADELVDAVVGFISEGLRGE